MRSLWLSLGVLLVGMQAQSEELRNCAYTGMSARAGDAKSIVSCAGYDDDAYLADDEVVLNIELILYTGEPAIDRKFERWYAVINQPRSGFRTYDFSLSKFNDLLLKGQKFPADELSALAVQDIQKALANRNPKIKHSQGNDLRIGTFSIKASSKLYRTPYKGGGFAPMKAPKAPLTVEEESRLNAKEQAQEERKRLAKKYDVQVTENNQYQWQLVDIVATGKLKIVSCITNKQAGIGFTNENRGTGFVYESQAIEMLFKLTGLKYENCTPDTLY